jgi:hypothetical protein
MGAWTDLHAILTFPQHSTENDDGQKDITIVFLADI